MKRSRARSPKVIQFARDQRAIANEFAHTVWQWIRNRQVCKQKFRREYPIPPYTADFCCVELKLILEVDGARHVTEEGRELDRVRDKFLAEVGYRVLRISGYDVLRNGERVLKIIEEVVRDRMQEQELKEDETVYPQPPLTPRPLSPRRGEGRNVIDVSDFDLHHLPEELTGETLSAAVKTLAGGISWGQARQMIAGRRVQVNGNLALDEQRRVKTGDVIKIWHKALPKPIGADAIQLTYIDEHLLVVEKPAGVTTMRHFEERNLADRRKQLQPTLDELIPEVIRRETGRNFRGGKGAIRPVHRLDRDTSGLMVFARTPAAEQGLVRLFSKHDIRRAYIAVALGRVEQQTVDHWLVRDVGGGKRGVAAEGEQAEGAQRAITHFRPMQFLADYTVLECRLETGRTHQIRIALASIGSQLCGEKTYHLVADKSGAPRQALHAAELGFVHPMTQEQLLFRMPLPRDMATWLATLKR